MSKYFKNNLQKLGVAGIPGTFPTGEVLSYIVKNFPHLKSQWDRGKVNEFYFAYKDLIKGGNDPWPASGMSDKLNTATGYNDSLMYFASLKNLIDKGEISPQWLMSTGPTGDPLDVFSNLSKGGLKIAKNMKFVGILAIAGVSIYFLWPWLSSARSKKKTKNKVS